MVCTQQSKQVVILEKVVILVPVTIIVPEDVLDRVAIVTPSALSTYIRTQWF